MSSTRRNVVTASSLVVGIVALVVILLFGGFSSNHVRAAPADAPGAQQSGEVQSSEACAECHAEEYEAWQDSTHSTASQTSDFQAAWVRSGRLDECLICHTTSIDTKAGEVSMEGVTCQACHTTEGDNHPPALMSVSVSSDSCGECHENTYKEWQISRHGERSIECAACHTSHSQTLRKLPADELCRQCHGKRLEDAAHTSHAQEDLSCTSCHMPANPAAEVTQGIGAVNPVGHTFNVGAQTCAECHEDQIHGQAREMAQDGTGNQGVSALGHLGAARDSQALEAARQRAQTLSSTVESLEQGLIRQRVLTYVGGAFGFGVGVFVGLLGALFLVFVLQKRGLA